ncbi:hypothetical protein E2C01_094357 [Portunus trituberculatus]|uniref:Uncharacterized protein n=1 Tax=Portunus trituberculatus TaxID=210409 RepID=A0A5B7JWM8_PORTR|nr:hypothetical protein [Portunus trituberculatus]
MVLVVVAGLAVVVVLRPGMFFAALVVVLDGATVVMVVVPGAVVVAEANISCNGVSRCRWWSLQRSLHLANGKVHRFMTTIKYGQ